jgi:hypothetical protein
MGDEEPKVTAQEILRRTKELREKEEERAARANQGEEPKAIIVRSRKKRPKRANFSAEAEDFSHWKLPETSPGATRRIDTEQPEVLAKGEESLMDPEHVEKLDTLLKELERRFGKLPLLVPSEPRMKGSYFKWGKLTQKLIEADDDYAKTYWRKMGGAVNAGGNLCVKLGTESDNLVTIDLDADELVEPFVAVNLNFAETVVTRGARGCQFWFYLDGNYPHKKLVIEFEGKSVGEFRGGKTLSNIWGVHPNGEPYTMVGEKAIRCAFKSIKWPKGWALVEEAKAPEIDWKAYFDVVKDADGGVVEALVAVYFAGARKTDTGW